MSFLIECIARQATLVPRVVVTQAPRAFSTSFVLNKTATETVKDGLKTVDRAVSDKIVDGINAGETVSSKVKQGIDEVTTGKTAGKAEELRSEAKAKATELGGDVKAKASELQGKAKGTAEHAKGKVQGAAEEAKSKM